MAEAPTPIVEVEGVPVQVSSIRGPAEDRFLDELVSLAPGPLPAEYLNLMKRMNGFVGNVTYETDEMIVRGSWLHLFRAEEIPELHVGNQIPEFAPTQILVGSNGGGQLYLIDTKTEEWVRVADLDIGSGPPPGGHEMRFPDLATMMRYLASRN